MIFCFIYGVIPGFSFPIGLHLGLHKR